MKKVKLYIAISLDGKIADKNGSVDWLEKVPNPNQDDYGYNDFIKSIDTTIMGNSTYKQVLSFPGPFPYSDFKNYVLTRDKTLTSDEYATFITADMGQIIKELKKTEGKDIWVIGGGQVNTEIHDLGLIDEYMIFVMPIILGEGIPLFGGHPLMTNLSLIDTKQYASGVTLIHYSRN